MPTPHPYNDITRLPIGALVRFSMEDLLKAFGCASGDMDGNVVIGLYDLLTMTHAALSGDLLALAITLWTSAKNKLTDPIHLDWHTHVICTLVTIPGNT